MTDPDFRRLERILKRDGRLVDFVLDMATELGDPKLIAELVDRLSSKLTVPQGQLLILNTDDPIVIRPGETVTFPVCIPMFEGGARASEIRCFRYVWTSTGSLAWRLYQRSSGRWICNTDGYIEAGQYSVPLAEDPFLLEQASYLDVEVSGQGLETIEATFTLICRHHVWRCWSCKDKRVAPYSWQAPNGEFAPAPCPVCCKVVPTRRGTLLVRDKVIP